MIQYNLIEKINAIFQSNTAIEAALLIGSFGRKTPKAHSDMDYQILVNSEFDNDKLFENLQLALNDTLKHHIYLPERRKWCLFLTEDYYVADIFICSELRQLDVHFLGSEIVHPENVLVFDKTNTVLPHVTHIIEEKQQNLSAIQQKTAETLILKFQYRFESMSAAHARSDGYKFSVVFSNALNALVRLIYLVQSDGKYEFMPPNFLTDYGYRLQLDVENLGTADLRLANKHKRKLLDLFSRYLPLVCQKYPSV